MDYLFENLADENATVSDMIVELLGAAEALAGQVDTETVVLIVTAVADFAADGLLVDQVQSFESPGGTVLQVVVPSSETLSSGFVLGSFEMPPLSMTRNVSVQAISWGENLFAGEDNTTVSSITVREGRETVALTKLEPALKFTVNVGERMVHSGQAFERSCVFWNITSGNWSVDGLRVARANLTQVDEGVTCFI